jgi:hypothetical protein
MGLMGGNAALDEIDHIAKSGPGLMPAFLGFAGGVNATKANLIDKTAVSDIRCHRREGELQQPSVRKRHCAQRP